MAASFVISAAMSLAAAAASGSPGFWLTGLPPGSEYSVAQALSKDGLVAAGGSLTPSFDPGFLWNADSGRYDFGLERGMPQGSWASGLNDDGSVVCGEIRTSNGFQHAYRWTGRGPLEDLGVLHNWPRSYADGISGDGQIVVGASEYGKYTNANGEAFRWTSETGMQGLGHLKPNGSYSRAFAISRDGSTIGGISQYNFDEGREAFKWTEATGMTKLPELPGAPSVWAEVRGVSADGSVIVGSSRASNKKSHAVRWIDGGIEDLAAGVPDAHSIALAVSDDGQVVGGRYAPGGIAFVWTPTAGLMDCVDYLEMNGVAVPDDWRLVEVLAISGDGLTIAGKAASLTGQGFQGFVATIPSPASSTLLFGALVVAARRRR